MANLELRIAELRRQRGISQQQLAEQVGVTFQTVSKWETCTTMPDITMLPVLAGYFQVSVDQLLGLQPLQGEEYLPVESGTRGYWEERADYLLRTRKTMINQDYIAFLVERVWQIQEPVKVLDCGCGLGFLASMLMPALPSGSAYHGVDLSQNLIAEGRQLLGQAGWVASSGQITMECGDFLESEICNDYDLVICQAVLRHIGQPIKFLEKMRQACRPGGLVVCIDVNRELESDGLYIQGMDYARLCGREGFPAMWKTELEKQDRDYAIGIRLPLLMEQLGLKKVQCRMNDRVNIISPSQEGYAEKLQDLMLTRGWTEDMEAGEKEAVNRFMNHGMTRAEAEDYCRKQREIREHLLRHQEDVGVVTTGGLMISYGWK
ncbi:MAG: methyltransferase domain-containing protein [Acetatifactor sp.]|nr:methyltransferase domain-containing protein [Acetatifactor sp.]